MKNKSRILIVDDDHGMTETMSDILEDMGYDVAVAEDGYRAIEMVGTEIYDIVFMDIKMPGINGVDTFKELKRVSPATRVIMMTAYSVEDLIKEALKEGAYAVIYKPLDIDKVVELIEKIEKGSLILVVDDDLNTCHTLRDVLEDMNYSVGVAYSGEEAINFIKNNECDILFIDIKMPVLNGLETYLLIKDIKPGITVIMMTAYRQEADELVRDAIKNNAYMCLYKPFNMNNILALVKKIFEQKQSGRLKKPDLTGNAYRG